MKKNILQRYGEFSTRKPELVLILALIVTLIMSVGAFSLEIETDFNKFFPQNIEAVKNQNLLNEEFSQSSNLFLLVRLDADSSSDSLIDDIRNPEVMISINRLEETLIKNQDISSVFGAPDILIQAMGFIPEDEESIKNFFSDSTDLFGRDYSISNIIVTVNGELEESRLNRVFESIESDINGVGFPGNVEVIVTGSPIISKLIFDLLIEDLTKTISLAIIFILLTLVIAYRSPVKAVFSVATLIIAIIWTAGTMKLLGVPLSLITVTVGSLIIGIGIDYTIHLINRYLEELKKRRDDMDQVCRDKKGNYSECMKSCFICYGITVDKVGTAIIGTAITTIISFSALTASGVPFLSDLGITLSLGVFYAMLASLMVFPSLLVIDERICKWFRGRIR